MGYALAPLVGDLPVWRKDRAHALLDVGLAYVPSVLRRHFGIPAEALAIGPETERRHWRAYNPKRFYAYLESTTDGPGLEEG